MVVERLLRTVTAGHGTTRPPAELTGTPSPPDSAPAVDQISRTSELQDVTATR